MLQKMNKEQTGRTREKNQQNSCLFESRNFIKKEILVIKKENGSIIRIQHEISSKTNKSMGSFIQKR